MSLLNIPPIQIPPPTEETPAVPGMLNRLHFPLLGSPAPQRKFRSFNFPSPASAASAAAAESAASILLSIAQPIAISNPPNATPAASPLAPPSKCRRVATSFVDYCRVCEILLRNVTPGIYADVCKSCESIQHRFRNGISFPACIICSSDAYHIHRNCNQAICKRCVRQHTLCPSCKVPIDKQ
jgi:hypothetical protein